MSGKFLVLVSQLPLGFALHSCMKNLNYPICFRAVYIRRKCGHKQLSSAVYLSEAEPFLEQYAKRSPQNQALIGSAGNLVSSEDFLAIVEGGRDEEGDLEQEKDVERLSPSPAVKDTVTKDKGLIIFFPGIGNRNLVLLTDDGMS